MALKNDQEKAKKETQSANENSSENNSKSTSSDKERKKTEHESGISRGTHVTPNSNSNAGRDI
jgi:hypothetical protein